MSVCSKNSIKLPMKQCLFPFENDVKLLWKQCGRECITVLKTVQLLVMETFYVVMHPSLKCYLVMQKYSCVFIFSYFHAKVIWSEFKNYFLKFHLNFRRYFVPFSKGGIVIDIIFSMSSRFQSHWRRVMSHFKRATRVWHAAPHQRLIT